MTEVCPSCHADRILTRSGVCETCQREIAAGRIEFECRQTPEIALCGEKTEIVTAGSCRQSTLF